MVEKTKTSSVGDVTTHLTPKIIFDTYIFQNIPKNLEEYRFVDLYCGEGGLILPILGHITPSLRPAFFKEHCFLCDNNPEMIEKAIINAAKYGVPRAITEKNIILNDSLERFPFDNDGLPFFHITNPPYLYFGHLAKMKEKGLQDKYMSNETKGIQDLYQLALYRDIKYGISRSIYIVPSNFLFGGAGTNAIRNIVLSDYLIIGAYIFETQIFEDTGQNVGIFNFLRKPARDGREQQFNGVKIDVAGKQTNRVYHLNPSNCYRAGGEFDEFIKVHKICTDALKVKFYLKSDEVAAHHGDMERTVVDVNHYDGNEYKRMKISIDYFLNRYLALNDLYVRTIDTGKAGKRVGLYSIEQDFHALGLLVTGNTYRTNPIQIFIESNVGALDIMLIHYCFNTILEHLRGNTDSEFLTTYKYTGTAEYTRKFLGLTQVRKIIEIIPILQWNDEKKRELQQKLIADSLTIEDIF